MNDKQKTEAIGISALELQARLKAIMALPRRERRKIGKGQFRMLPGLQRPYRKV